MKNLASPKVIKEIIEQYQFRFSKSLGQNFLIDGNVVRKIVDLAEINQEDNIIEIGPGIGTLTQILCERAKKVVAVEIDRKLIPILHDNLKEYDNFKIFHGDILKINIEKLIKEEFNGKSVKVVANLPYYVTTPIVISLLEQKHNIHSITIMIQKEVAQRMNASPGTKDYGALTVAVKYYSSPKIGFTVAHQCFMPQPKVDSAVLRLDILDSPTVDIKNEKIFFDLVRAAFSQRRKTLINSLVNSGSFNLNKESAKELLIKIGLSENQRGETLTISQFAELANAISLL